MSRRYVNQFAHQESIDQVFLAANKQLRPNRNGNLYLQVELSDRSGSLQARMWNAGDDVYRSFDDGAFVRVEGVAQMFQGAMQLIVSSITSALESEIDPADFQTVSTVDIDRQLARLKELLRTLRDPHLRTLADCFLVDDVLLGKLCRAPAGIKNHHAYHGGLLEHVVNLMEVCHRVTPLYPALNPDLLLLGAFLHDLGKVEELAYERSFSYTDEGQLIGHLVIAVEMLADKVREAEKLSGEPIPKDLVIQLKHIIVSHHGEYEFGSPKLPMTLEAVAIHLLDNLDAKLHSFQQLMREDPNVESPWTHYNPQLSRKLYKGRAT